VNLKSTIESILFSASRPVSLLELVKITNKAKQDVLDAIDTLSDEKKDSGIVVLEQNKRYLLATHPDASETVAKFLNSELRESLTEAALETLAIITYKQPASRAEIESIRGVNSQYTLRLLMIRGLIEKTKSRQDQRVQLYKTTHEFLQHLGIQSTKDLPEFSELTKKVKPPEEFNVTEETASPS